MIHRVAFALIFGSLLAERSEAQAPAAPAGVARPADLPPPLPVPAALPARAANNHADPLNDQGRFANPGGIGRHSEYYTRFTPMYGYPGPSNRVAVFGQGGGPTRADQVEAFRAGQYRTRNIQSNINAYGRPIGFGYGFGYGYGYGRGLGGFR